VPIIPASPGHIRPLRDRCAADQGARFQTECDERIGKKDPVASVKIGIGSVRDQLCVEKGSAEARSLEKNLEEREAFGV
jgi:hypothetical protein